MRDMMVASHLDFRNAKLRWARMQHSETSDGEQLGCTRTSLPGAKVIPTSSPCQLGSRRAGYVWGAAAYPEEAA